MTYGVRAFSFTFDALNPSVHLSIFNYNTGNKAAISYDSIHDHIRITTSGGVAIGTMYHRVAMIYRNFEHIPRGGPSPGGGLRVYLGDFRSSGL